MAYIKRNWILLTSLFTAFVSIGVLATNLNYAAEKSKKEENEAENSPQIRIISNELSALYRAYVPAQAGNVASRTIGTSYQPSLQRMAIIAPTRLHLCWGIAARLYWKRPLITLHGLQ